MAIDHEIHVRKSCFLACSIGEKTPVALFASAPRSVLIARGQKAWFLPAKHRPVAMGHKFHFARLRLSADSGVVAATMSQ
jgi:hypothetical protein